MQLDAGTQGRYDITLDYLAMLAGETYTFDIKSDFCAPGLVPDVDLCTAVTGDSRSTMLEITTDDACSGGHAGGTAAVSTPDEGRDLRFEATFADAIPVPEPASALLALVGLVGLGWVRRSAFSRRS